MRIQTVIFLLTLTLVGNIFSKQDTDKVKAVSTKIEGAAAKRFEEAFSEEYMREQVHRQIFVVLRGREPVEGEKIEVAMTMHGPHIFRRDSDKTTRAYLTLGAMGYYQVNFDVSTKAKESFFVGQWGEEEARFETFKEMHTWVMKQLDKLLKGKK